MTNIQCSARSAVIVFVLCIRHTYLNNVNATSLLYNNLIGFRPTLLRRMTDYDEKLLLACPNTTLQVSSMDLGNEHEMQGGDNDQCLTGF